MIVRECEKDDFLALPPNLSGDLQPIDTILVVGAEGKPNGSLVYRKAVFIHGMNVGEDMISRARAAALIDAAIKRDGSRCAVFLVAAGNKAMQRYVERLGAVKQSDPGDLLYTLTV